MPAAKRYNSFSAWLRDNGELQIRINEKVLRNLSATLRRLTLCQGCLTHIPIFQLKMEPLSSHKTVITLHLVMQK